MRTTPEIISSRRHAARPVSFHGINNTNGAHARQRTKVHRGVVITISLLLVLAGCNTTERDFRRAELFDSIGAYEGFVRAHPDSEFEDKAREALERLRREEEERARRRAEAELAAWSSAQSSNTAIGYLAFVDEYPESERVSTARARIRAAIEASALEGVGGDRSRLQPQESFPLHRFAARDVLAGFGTFYHNLMVIDYRGGFRTVSYEISFKDSRRSESAGWNVSQWEGDLRRNAIAAAESKAVTLSYMLSMASPVSNEITNVDETMNVVFYTDSSLNVPLTLVLTIDFFGGRLVSESAKIKGPGFAVLRDGDKVTVFEFADRDESAPE